MSSRRELRNERKMARISSRENKALGRQAARTQIKTTAYESGIDPNAWIGDVAKSAAELGGKFIGAPGGIGAAGKRAASEPDSPDGGPDTQKGAGGGGSNEGGMMEMLKNPVVLIGLAAVAFFLLKKKK